MCCHNNGLYLIAKLLYFMCSQILICEVSHIKALSDKAVVLKAQLFLRHYSVGSFCSKKNYEVPHRFRRFVFAGDGTRASSLLESGIIGDPSVSML